MLPPLPYHRLRFAAWFGKLECRMTGFAGDGFVVYPGQVDGCGPGGSPRTTRVRIHARSAIPTPVVREEFGPSDSSLRLCSGQLASRIVRAE